MCDPQLWNGQRLIGDWFGLQQSEREVPLICTSEGQQVQLPIDRLGEFVETHGYARIAGQDLPCVFAKYLIELSSSRNQVAAVWSALTEGRILDLGVADSLVRLADPTLPPLAAITESTDIGKHGQAVFGRLKGASAGHESEVRIPTFGPLGVGLNVAASTALEITRQRGLKIGAEAKKHLVDACFDRANAIIDNLSERNGDPFPGHFGRERKNLPKSVVQRAQILRVWQNSLRKQIRDGREVQLDAFLLDRDGLDGEPETWPLWAQCVPFLPQWCALRRVCLLWHQLEEADGPMRPQYGVLPRLRTFSDQIRALSKDLTDVISPRDGHILLRIDYPRLITKTIAQLLLDEGSNGLFVEHLQSDGDPIEYLAEALAPDISSFEGFDDTDMRHCLVELLLEMITCGTWSDGLEHIVCARFGTNWRCNSRAIRKSMFATFPDLRQLQLDRTVECLAHAAGLPADLFPKLDAKHIADCFQMRNQPVRTSPEFDFRSVLLASNSPRAKRILNQLRHVPGSQMYRRLTDETILSPAGTVRSGLIWVAARFESIRGPIEDLLKQLVVGLATRGYMVIAIEDIGVVVEVPKTSENHVQQVRELADHFARATFPDVRVVSRITCPELAKLGIRFH